jgi:hypothetical protein
MMTGCTSMDVLGLDTSIVINYWDIYELLENVYDTH